MMVAAGWRRPAAILVAVVWLGLPESALGHAAIVERLAAMDERIAECPKDPALYLKRGELHRLHRDWKAALADYARAARMAPDNPVLDYYMGRMRLESGRPDLARPALDRFLAVRPNHADALLNRARVLARLGKPRLAAADLTKAIARLRRPSPGIYLERARLRAAVGPDDVDAALAGLDQGIARLGPLASLIQFAVSIEAGRGRYDAALARIDALPLLVRSGAAWLARRGDILLRAGRRDAARATYTSAIEAIARRPPARRRTRAMAALDARLHGALGRLTAGGENSLGRTAP